jgi:hypothetical protein
MVHWLVSGAALVLALLAWGRSRRLARRLARVTRDYWELRYEHDQLRDRVGLLEPGGEGKPSAPPVPGPPTAFVPLSALRR